MWGKVGAVVVLAGVAVVLVFLGALASGPPGSPTAAISTAPSPAQGTTYTVTVSYQEYSLVTPSFFGWNGQALIVSAYWTAPNGAKTVVEQQQHMVASVLSSHGDLYTIGTSFSFTVAAQCSSSCAGDVMNVTVTAYGINPTGDFWSSATGPAATATFSNVGAYTSAPAAGAAPGGIYTASLAIGFLGALGASLAAVTVARPNAYTGVAAAVAWGAAGVAVAAAVLVMGAV